MYLRKSRIFVELIVNYFYIIECSQTFLTGLFRLMCAHLKVEILLIVNPYFFLYMHKN